MHRIALLTCLLTVSLMNQVSGLGTVMGKYGDTIEIPCNNGRVVEAEVTFVKWKYDKDGNILVKNQDQNTTVFSDVNYKNRVSIKQDFSLVITQVAMTDQRTFTCMVVLREDILEYPVQLAVYNVPSEPQITNLTTVMEIGKPTTLAQCRSEGANPAANITWFRNKTPLMTDGAAIKITTNVDVDKATGLSTTTSTLEYTAVKGDIDAKFTCQVQHIKSANMDSSPLVFTVNYPTEKVNLQVVSQGPFKEGDNVTLKCTADGNPPPSSYNFYIKGEKKTVDSNTYTLTSVTRENTGEYQCSLVDHEDIVASVPITVEYLDVVFSSTGKIVKKLGESLEMNVDVKASGAPQTSWKKGNAKLNSQPKFDKLMYSDSGVYECVVSMAGLKKTHTFELVVEGSPVIKNLIKERGEGMTKVLKCVAEGFPKPTVQWSVNGSNAESVSEHGKVTYSLTIVPNGNLSVSCTVSNVLGFDIKSINVSALVDDDVTMDKQADQKDEKSDQTILAVGIVFGLMLAVLAIGLAYWLYMKKFRQGSWKTGEKEDGSTEESKKLEENQSQKADV
ncbi:CD166 antigen homolog A-like isoform X1 [Cyprinus carpio]|uniref:CD166 antigen homolog A-like isoform X1 n=1 Tax=Cyprinus carpio TaxID=7962 RepID=A0A9Q9X4Y2_CYPCA|nr:CD166 antigen homolog A-like isoform X1 [Cyprinus carpio]XP_042595319.1 CD166 antigen homolog A-like isoform X1 [Cyprinus carpio]